MSQIPPCSEVAYQLKIRDGLTDLLYLSQDVKFLSFLFCAISLFGQERGIDTETESERGLLRSRVCVRSFVGVSQREGWG